MKFITELSTDQGQYLDKDFYELRESMEIWDDEKGFAWVKQSSRFKTILEDAGVEGDKLSHDLQDQIDEMVYSIG